MAPSFLSIVSVYGGYIRRCFAGAGLSSQTLKVDDETTVHFWGPRNETAQKPSVVLIHGFGPAALWQWRQQVQFLAPHFNVYVPDLIFFGGSSTRSSERSEVFQAASEQQRRVDAEGSMDKIEDLMLPATPQHLRKLMSLSIHKPPQILPDFFLRDFLDKLYAENRKEKMELLKGLTIGKDDTSNISPLRQSYSGGSRSLGGTRSNISCAIGPRIKRGNQ
ncbi:monoacylglycerol lipase ABHD6 [Spatholobus suberectus]|nr:monoacylglycerol lipase ABHD6 [Spatholobus suberectus]